jgi:hypothetical protein
VIGTRAAPAHVILLERLVQLAMLLVQQKQVLDALSLLGVVRLLHGNSAPVS